MKNFVLAFIVLVSNLAQKSARADAQSADQPLNVVVLYADDWRHDTLGCAGHPVVKTPRLDELAGRGIRFTHAYVTTAICGVSRASLLTGQWMSRHGNRGFDAFATPWAETYPGMMRARGYYVGQFGKWHCGKFPQEQFDAGAAYGDTHWQREPGGGEIHVTKKMSGTPSVSSAHGQRTGRSA
jgi:arylsulfatase